MTTHKVKILPVWFDQILRGIKTWENRIDDRGYEVGDQLVLREWLPDSQQFTGREISTKIVGLQRRDANLGINWIKPEYVLLSLGEVFIKKPDEVIENREANDEGDLTRSPEITGNGE